MKKTVRLWLTPLIALMAIVIILVVFDKQTTPFQRDKGFIFGTVYNISYKSNDNLHAGIRHELECVDASLSMFNDSSCISHVNRNESNEADSMLAEVFTLAHNVSHDTDGAFDITVAPLVNAWGFGFKSGNHPTPQTVDSLIQLTGYKKVNINDGIITKSDSRIMLDCSAIAKGYGCDVVAHYLRDKGIHDFMVEIGGEIVVSGHNEQQQAWHIGVSKPTDDTLTIGKQLISASQQHQHMGNGKQSARNELQTILKVSDVAMATSGNYRNFYYKDGRKYAHTIDPRTGYPVQHNILSATVFAPNCATADAYATAFMVMGLDKAKQILARHPELMAYIIYSDSIGRNAIWHSSRLAPLLTE